MPGTNVVRRALLPLPSVRVGRIVRNIEQPLSDYYDDPALVASLVSIVPSTKSDFRYTERKEADNSFAGTLARLFSTSYSKGNGSATQVKADKIMTYALPNSSPFFKGIIQNGDARRWIKESVEMGENMYLITGIHTMLNAHIVQGAASSSKLSGRVRGPVTDALIEAGIIRPADGGGDVAVDGTNFHAAGVRREYVANGEHICAIEYRQIYSPKDVEKSSLGKENSINFGGIDVRAKTMAGDDVMAFDLRDNVEFDPEEVNTLYEKYTGDEGVFLY